MKRGKRNARANPRLTIGLSIVCVIVLIAAYMIALRMEDEAKIQARGDADSTVGLLERVVYNNKTYVEKTDLTSILVMGVDQTSGEKRYGARQGGQADFLMLLVIDHPMNQIHALQIDRDTIAQVETLGILGNPIGTKPMQICLAHAFGKTAHDSCAHTVKAVSNLLEGVEIDYYMSLSMDSMARINDVLGGVPVTLEDDFSAADPEMTAGKTLVLTNRQAEIFMRGRMEVGDGTNNARMRRHRQFIENAMERMRALQKEDAHFASEAYDRLQDVLTTSISKNRLTNEANRAYHYELMPIKTLEGSYSKSEDGFVEFHVKDGAVAEWVVETLFKPE